MGQTLSKISTCFSSSRTGQVFTPKRNVKSPSPTDVEDQECSPSNLVISPISATEDSNSAGVLLLPSEAVISHSNSAGVPSEELISPTPTTNERSWAWLPAELVGSIAERLTPGDFFRFRSVCTAWASAITVGGYLPLRNFHPWLMLSDNPYSFFSIPENLSYHYPSDIRCIECLCAQNGWLAIVHGDSKYCLLNPLTRSQINLPPVSRDFHVRKIVMSSTPSANISSSFIIVAMYGLLYYSLAFSRAGSTSWTSIRLTHGMDEGIEDVVYHDGNFFAISTRGQVQALDLSGPCPTVSSFVNSHAEVEQSGYLLTRYLVSSFGDLLLVRKQRGFVRTRQFIIMKFNPEIDSCWEEITDLGTRSLFLDNKNLTSISASEITEHKGNCIYFTNEHMDFHDNYVCDVKIFDIKSGTIQPCFRPQLQFSCSLQLPPIWFMPSLS